ncbi:type IV pilus assembly protein FimV [Vreelandella songnenensis]|uniref:type IV pilus assembly protein FimV n=1 Tax=Vreelandella songnenensis TaxID=1176243 RepID=UPI00142D2F1B|nr:FimV/HubP family polar landmark protein [Halomonas songnenensis]
MFKPLLPPAAFTVAAGLALSAASFPACALELAPASVASTLRAPLNATIALHDADIYPLSEIHVSLAEKSAFEEQGLEWMPGTEGVDVELKQTQGSRYIAIHSAQPITSSWIDLLLNIEYPEGRLTHPVTLLLDPPGYGQNEHSQSAAWERHATPASVESPETSADKALVRAGDTLWSIAERSKPAEASVQQMMLALVQANPVIFPRGDINRLQAGQALNVPGAEQALARSRTDAADAVQVMVRTGQYPRASSAVEPLLTQASEVDEAGDMPLAVSAPLNTPAMADTPATSDAIAELTARLEESQARLQHAEAEREQLRLALGELRESVDALRQRIDEPQPALPGPVAAASAGPTDAGLHGQHQEPAHDLLTGLERYQWPLISLALCLLLVGLIWLRKRRETDDQWRGASQPGPGLFTTTMSSYNEPNPPAPQNIPLSSSAGANVYSNSKSPGDEKSDGLDHPAGAGSHAHEAALLEEEQALSQSSDYSRSQAAGLTGQRYSDLTRVQGRATPTVFAPSVPSDSEQALPRREVEEVAFKPRGRDNS